LCEGRFEIESSAFYSNPIQQFTFMTRSRSGRNAVIDLSTKFPRNSKGGVHVKDEDISLAFEFFQIFGNEQVLTWGNMKKAFQALNKNLSKTELMLMFAGKESITVQEVRDLLRDNQISTIDPISEAFSVLDPTNTGFVQETKIRKIFENFGFGELSAEELLVLIDESDFDKDGRLGLEDFRRLARPPNESQLAVASLTNNTPTGEAVVNTTMSLPRKDNIGKCVKDETLVCK